MRIRTKFKKEKGFQYNSYILKNDLAPPQQIEVFLLDDAYQNSFISQSEYFIQRIEDLPISSIGYFVENRECWKVMDGGEIIQIVVFGKRSYQKTIELLELLLNKYSLALDSIVLNFEDKNFIKELVKAIY